jgi:hypothetical protein
MSRVDTSSNTQTAAQNAETDAVGLHRLESGIPEVLERMHKKLKISDVMKAIRIMNSLSSVIIGT